MILFKIVYTVHRNVKEYFFTTDKYLVGIFSSKKSAEKYIEKQKEIKKSKGETWDPLEFSIDRWDVR